MKLEIGRKRKRRRSHYFISLKTRSRERRKEAHITMPIFYALIARDGHILSEATSRTVEAGNFQQIALQILAKIGQEGDGAKRSFSTGG